MKLIYIENVLILVNLILILYLVYVLSNRTIEKFYHEDLGLDPSVPGFEPHTHRDSTSTPENEGCGDLCGSRGWKRPSIPSINGATTSITDNTLTISNITLSESIDHPFYDLWYIEIGIFQGAWKTVESMNDGSIRRIATSNHNVYNLNDIFNRNETLKGNIIINLSNVDVTNDFTLYLGILDEHYSNPTLDDVIDVWNRFTFNVVVEYTLSCSPNYYNFGSGCAICPTYSNHSLEGCSNCPAGSERLSLTGQCTFCLLGTYRSETMPECGTCPDAHQQPNSGATACVDCPLGKYKAAGSEYCSTICPGGTQANANRNGCTPCPSGHARDPLSVNGCIRCPGPASYNKYSCKKWTVGNCLGLYGLGLCGSWE